MMSLGFNVLKQFQYGFILKGLNCVITLCHLSFTSLVISIQYTIFIFYDNVFFRANESIFVYSKEKK